MGIDVRIGLILTLLTVSGGCGNRAAVPETHAVTGTVKFADGKAVPAGTLLDFQSQTEPRYTTQADVVADGRFTVRTIAGKERLEGAVAGTYQLTVMLPNTGDSASGGPQKILPIVLTQTFTVKPGGPNTFQIELPKPGR
jgi:hypothetical protein